MPTLRSSHDDDLPAINAINAIGAIDAHPVRHGTGTFETDMPSPADLAARRADVLTKNLPCLVAERGSQGQLGAPLLAARPQAAEAAGVRKLIAVMGDAANAASLGVHRSQGLTEVGVLKDCGWPFGRWLDGMLMEKTMGAGSSRAPQKVTA